MQNETKKLTTPIDIQISQINDAKLLGQRVTFEALVNDLEEIPFVPPSKLKLECEPNMDFPICQGCGHSSTSGTTKHLTADYPDILKFINCKEEDLWALYKRIIKAPAKCSRLKFEEVERVNISQGSLVPTVEYIGKNDDGVSIENIYTVIVETVFIGKDIVEANRSYKLQGVPHRDPKNGRIVFLVDKAEGIMDDINSFKLTPGMIKALQEFQPKEWTEESLIEKLDDVHKEMRINHHKINGRESVAFFMDLVYHSVIGFEWGQSTHLRGWLQLAVCGDTSVGKSEMIEKMVQMHQMGYIIPGESISYAGLMGGVVSQNNKRNGNVLHWGILPKHDKRIVHFDESHHENATAIWPLLNDVNTSGIAKYNKIIQRQAPARVRKIFSSNPPRGTSVSDYIHPCEMMKGVYTSPEVIRRFDALVVPTALDVKPSMIAREEPTIKPHYYEHWGFSGEAQYKGKSPGYWLLRYIYSRKPEQTIFEEDARQLLIKEADRMCKKYTSAEIPLVEPGSIRFKLARGACALAGRSASMTELFDTILVRKCHVIVYIKALEAQYDGTTGYLGFSEKMFKTTKFENKEEFFNICCKVKSAMSFKSNRPLLERIYQQNSINFKELTFIWDSAPDIIRKISTVLLSNGLVTPNLSMTSFRKNRKGILVLAYLLGPNVDLAMMISDEHCYAYFEKNT